MRKIRGGYFNIPFAALWLLGVVMTNASAQDVIPAQRSNLSSDRYEINQTFGGEAFWKDNNIWVYNADFAETFGMPKIGIDPQLTGIEAAAFRIEESGYKLCGMGGKADQCMNSNARCMLDIYIDERKHPLPWVNPEQMADWLRTYNSSLFLRTPTKEHAIVKATARFTPNKLANTASLHPFADPITTKEAIFLENKGEEGEATWTFHAVQVLGYKKQVIVGLTLVSLRQDCLSSIESKQVEYRLESRDAIFSPPLKTFLTFTLSATFAQQIRLALQAKSEANAQYFRNLLNLKPAAAPQPLKGE